MFSSALSVWKPQAFVSGGNTFGNEGEGMVNNGNVSASAEPEENELDSEDWYDEDGEEDWDDDDEWEEEAGLLVPALPPIKISLSRCADGEPAVPHKLPGLCTKLGGEPDWIEEPETPICDSCEMEMSFVAQIDSIEHFADYNPLAMNPEIQQDYMFGNSGMIYVFFCFECCTTKALCQIGDVVGEE